MKTTFTKADIKKAMDFGFRNELNNAMVEITRKDLLKDCDEATDCIDYVEELIEEFKLARDLVQVELDDLFIEFSVDEARAELIPFLRKVTVYDSEASPLRVVAIQHGLARQVVVYFSYLLKVEANEKEQSQ